MENILGKLTSAGQDHLLHFYSQLEDEAKEDFLIHLNTLDYEEVNALYTKAMESLSSQVEKLDDRMKPIPAEQFEAEANLGEEQLEKYESIGLEEVSEGRVCVLLMAGGQGTRLGVSYPKGMYSVGLPSGKTLFQIQAERISRLQELAKEKTGKLGTITWYVMTSGPTVGPTIAFLEDHRYFGLKKENVVIFQQGLLPCFDLEGKIILDDKNRISLAPDGNGGIYRALRDNGILADMENRGISYVHVHSVDNILIKVADPVFIGYCVSKRADCGAKVVQKSGPFEAVGVVCLVDDSFQVVEYSEITETTANLRDETGNLVFNAGNICNHFFTRTFLVEIAEKHLNDLKLHVAKKKIPYINKAGEKIKPSTPNGIKIEKFVFDVFEFASNFVTWEVPRHSEFSALKNGDDTGKDCPSTARRDLLNLHRIYVEKAGGKALADVEISPLLSYAGENLEVRCSGKVFQTSTVISE